MVMARQRAHWGTLARCGDAGVPGHHSVIERAIEEGYESTSDPAKSITAAVADARVSMVTGRSFRWARSPKCSNQSATGSLGSRPSRMSMSSEDRRMDSDGLEAFDKLVPPLKIVLSPTVPAMMRSASVA